MRSVAVLGHSNSRGIKRFFAIFSGTMEGQLKMKHQVPTSKLQRNTKLQISNVRWLASASEEQIVHQASSVCADGCIRG
jgi:hypothetical protein